MATLGKPQRQHRIARLLEEQAISSQAQLVEMLASDGVMATQATVSRDLEELGAVKVRIPGGTMAYAIPEHAKERTAPDDHLRRVMGEFVVEVAHSANLVVLRTPPGSAHVVGVRDRPGRSARRARHRGRRRHDHPGVLRATVGGAASPPSSPPSPGSERRRRSGAHGEASGAGVLRRSRHVGGGEVDRRGVGRRGGRARGRRRPGPTTGTTIRPRALAAGAVEAKVVDVRAEFADDFLVPRIHANALYEGKYPLVSALSRPVIAKHLVVAAREFGADAVAHGCTGKGNDQVRFEVSVRALAPDLDVLAPVRVWGFTREDCIDYAAKHDIPISVDARRARTRSTRTSGAAPSSAARWRTRGSRRPPTSTRSRATSPTRRPSPATSSCASSRACRSRSTAWRCRCTSW